MRTSNFLMFLGFASVLATSFVLAGCAGEEAPAKAPVQHDPSAYLPGDHVEMSVEDKVEDDAPKTPHTPTPRPTDKPNVATKGGKPALFGIAKKTQ